MKRRKKMNERFLWVETDPLLDVCVREPIMDPLLDVCVVENHFVLFCFVVETDPLLDVCVREPIMDPLLDVL